MPPLRDAARIQRATLRYAICLRHVFRCFTADAAAAMLAAFMPRRLRHMIDVAAYSASLMLMLLRRRLCATSRC